MFITGRHLCETCELYDYYSGCRADNEVKEGEYCIACDDYKPKDEDKENRY